MTASKLDYAKLKQFWNKQAGNYGKTHLYSLSCLGDEPELLEYRHESEKRHFLKIMKLTPFMTVLDVGCGIGRWTLTFARKCQKVVAIDFAEDLLKIAKLEAEKKGLKNIEFKKVNALDFKTKEKFDVIFFSGLLQYISDKDMSKLIKDYSGLLKMEGIILNRGPSALKAAYAYAHMEYNALYRSQKDYDLLFNRENLQLIYSNFAYPPFNLPSFLYYRFVPKCLKSNTHIKNLLWVALKLHIKIDPILIKFKLLHSFLLNLKGKKRAMKVSIYKKAGYSSID